MSTSAVRQVGSQTASQSAQEPASPLTTPCPSLPQQNGTCGPALHLLRMDPKLAPKPQRPRAFVWKGHGHDNFTLAILHFIGQTCLSCTLATNKEQLLIDCSCLLHVVFWKGMCAVARHAFGEVSTLLSDALSDAGRCMSSASEKAGCMSQPRDEVHNNETTSWALSWSVGFVWVTVRKPYRSANSFVRNFALTNKLALLVSDRFANLAKDCLQLESASHLPVWSSFYPTPRNQEDWGLEPDGDRSRHGLDRPPHHTHALQRQNSVYKEASTVGHMKYR